MAVSCGYWCPSAISVDPPLARGSFDEARRLYQELLDTGEFSSEQSRFHLLQKLGLSHLGLALARQFVDPEFFSSTEGRAAVAEGARQLRAAVVLMTEEASVSGPMDILFFQQALVLLERFGTPEESRETLHQIRNLYPFAMLGAGSEYAGNILIREAEIDRELGDLVKSEKKFLRGLWMLDAHGKGDSREAALARYGLAATLQAQERRGAEAQQALAQAEWSGWQFGLTDASAAEELVSGCGDYGWSLAPGGGLAETLFTPRRAALP